MLNFSHGISFHNPGGGIGRLPECFNVSYQYGGHDPANIREMQGIKKMPYPVYLRRYAG